MDSIITTTSIHQPFGLTSALRADSIAQPRCLAGIATAIVFAAAFVSAPAAAAVVATLMAAAAFGACAQGRSVVAAYVDGRNVDGRNIDPIAFRPFSSTVWHLTTNEKKGHSQQERCT